MSNYLSIRNILASAFSIETGLDDCDADAMYRRAYELNPKLREEVNAIFTDKAVAWTEILCNEDYEVFETESEEEARDYAKEILINYDKKEDEAD